MLPCSQTALVRVGLLKLSDDGVMVNTHMLPTTWADFNKTSVEFGPLILWIWYASQRISSGHMLQPREPILTRPAVNLDPWYWFFGYDMHSNAVVTVPSLTHWADLKNTGEEFGHVVSFFEFAHWRTPYRDSAPRFFMGLLIEEHRRRMWTPRLIFRGLQPYAITDWL